MPNAACRVVFTILATGKVAVAAHELFPAAHGFFERQVLQTMKGIVVNECPHRPVLGDDLAGEVNDSPQLHSSRFDVRCAL